MECKYDVLDFTIKWLQQTQLSESRNVKVDVSSKPIIMRECVGDKYDSKLVGYDHHINVLDIAQGMEDKARLLGYELEDERDDK